MSVKDRERKYGYDVNKYYERIVKKLTYAFSDIMLAYENLPDEQRNKIDLVTQVDILLNYINDKKIEGIPDKIIQSAKSQLYSIIKTRIRQTALQKLAEPDFEKVTKWLEFLTPANPKIRGPPL